MTESFGTQEAASAAGDAANVHHLKKCKDESVCHPATIVASEKSCFRRRATQSKWLWPRAPDATASHFTVLFKLLLRMV